MCHSTESVSQKWYDSGRWERMRLEWCTLDVSNVGSHHLLVGAQHPSRNRRHKCGRKMTATAKQHRRGGQNKGTHLAASASCWAKPTSTNSENNKKLIPIPCRCFWIWVHFPCPSVFPIGGLFWPKNAGGGSARTAGTINRFDRHTREIFCLRACHGLQSICHTSLRASILPSFAGFPLFLKGPHSMIACITWQGKIV